MHEHNHVVFIVWLIEEISIPTPSWRVIGNFLRGRKVQGPKVFKESMNQTRISRGIGVGVHQKNLHGGIWMHVVSGTTLINFVPLGHQILYESNNATSPFFF